MARIDAEQMIREYGSWLMRQGAQELEDLILDDGAIDSTARAIESPDTNKRRITLDTHNIPSNAEVKPMPVLKGKKG